MPSITWHNRDADLTRAALTPYRLLEPVQSLHYGEQDSPNMLIQGDNLAALKALLPYYAGQVKCVFIDPPYNTKSAFQHYDDNLEHSQWLSMMYPRLELLRELLSQDGSIWITIDDNEGHYLKVLCDEIFGRRNFVASVIWQKLHARNNSAQHLSADHDFVLVYARDLSQWKRNKVGRTEASDADFWNPDNDPRGDWRRSDLTAAKPYADGRFEVVGPYGDVFTPRGNRWWSISQTTFEDLRADKRIWWGKTGRTFPFRKRFKSELGELVPTTVWTHEEVGNNREAKQEITRIFGRDDLFSTPKPERLVQRALRIASDQGDLVLDSFLGSGTTAAVAHKMGRRWIGVEMGDHARTHCVPRLQQVVDGEQGGVSQSVGWQGGGGFRFYRLGPPVFDETGHINDGIRFEHLAAHIWFAETGVARSTRAVKHAFLGEHHGVGYYLLFNGVLGDTALAGGNVLTKRVLRSLPAFDGPKVIYGEASALSDEEMRDTRITFRQTPYDIKAR